MSVGIEQILFLLERMAELSYITDFYERRKQATHDTAKQFQVTYSTIANKWNGTLGIRADIFDQLVRNLLYDGNNELLNKLTVHADEADLLAIAKIERALGVTSNKPAEQNRVEVNDARTVKLAPSILSADYAYLGNAVIEATEAGADYIHIDVMDGHFVPPITVGAQMVKALRPLTKLPLDVHLMVESPEHYIDQFAAAGADIITVHVEAATHLHRTIQRIKGLGKQAGVSLNPATPLSELTEILPSLNLVLVMTVNPGFGGQAFIVEMLEKIARLRAELDRRSLEVELEVDGGISASNAAEVVRAGANILVAGTAVFDTGRPVKDSLARIRASL